MEKQKANKFPWSNCSQLTGRPVIYMTAERTCSCRCPRLRRTLSVNTWRRMELLKESLARPPSLPMPPLSSPVLTETASCFRDPGSEDAFRNAR